MAAPAIPVPEDDGYQRHKEQARRRQADLSRDGRDVADWIRPPADPQRKARAFGDFRFFCETFFPHTFRLGWSEDHLRLIRAVEETVLRGGQKAYSMPRGFGKTSLAIAACIWALLHGHHAFVALIAATQTAAKELLDSIKAELECNALLDADYSEVTGPIRAMEGITNRCAGQHVNGERTRIRWTASEVILPMVKGSRASGGVVRVAGITGRVRGMQCKHPDGRTLRPSLVLVDDCQTDRSADSPPDCKKREKTLSGAVLGLAGPGQPLSVLATVTVIRKGDVADRILDRDVHPAWRGERMKMLYSFPERADLWDRYAELRADSMRAGGDGQEATEFYRANRAEMDRGARIAWPQRFSPGQLSALQFAMDKLLDMGKEAFSAECQNEPKGPEDEAVEVLAAEAIRERLSRLERGLAPAAATLVTVGVDVHDRLLYWAAVAWSPDFTGWVLDYGAWPRQRRREFTLRQAAPTLAEAYPGAGKEGTIRAGLEALTADLLGREWRREGGTPLRAERCTVDSGYLPDVVFEFCRRSAHAAVLLPSRGVGIKATGKPMAEYQRRQGEKHGNNWIVRPVAPRAGRMLLYGTNHWKSFVHARLWAAAGDRGSLTLFGSRAEEHRLFSEHLAAEAPARNTSNGRTVDEWAMRPGQADNHWLDCLAAAAAAASERGAALPAHQAPAAAPGKAASWSQQQREAKERRRKGA